MLTRAFIATQLLVSFWCSGQCVTPVFAQDVQDFYSKNRLTIIVGVPAGGAYDLEARLVGRLLPKYLPGHPSVIVQNMPGANTTLAANYIYNTAPQDGTVIGASSRTMPYATLMGSTGVRFDPLKINWLGSTAGESAVCISWHTSAVKTASDLFQKELLVGATDPGGDFFVYPNVLNHVIGTRFKMVMGYKSKPEISLAMERGEVQGMGSYPVSGLLSEQKDWVAEHKVNLLMQLNVEKDPDFPNVPLALEFAKTDEQRQILDVFLEMKRFAYPFFVGPSVPTARVRALQKAFSEVTQDSEFKAEQLARAVQLTAAQSEPMTNAIRRNQSLPAAVQEKIRAIMSYQ
jgi:tripartite-type tricarboxylate transporter receptor subunit TctC